MVRPKSGTAFDSSWVDFLHPNWANHCQIKVLGVFKRIGTVRMGGENPYYILSACICISLYYIYVCVCTFQKPPQQQKKQKNSGQPLKVWSLALAPSAPAFDIKDLTSPVAHPDSILGGQRARSFWLSVSLLWTLLSQSQVVNCHFFIGRKCKTRQKKHMKHSIV